jgi:AcrR family transcriptional regulator
MRNEMNPPETPVRVGEPEHHGGRPLDASRDVALRDATLALLAELGYDRLTMEAVAARAHSSKTTIYRRWSGKAELVVDALNSLKESRPVPDTGSLRGDLEAMARGSASIHNRFDAQLMIGLISALSRYAELRRVVRERLVDPGQSDLKQVFDRAVARGEIAPDRNLDILVSVFPALMIHHLLTSGEIPEAHFAEQVMTEVIWPLATAATTVSNV